MIYRQLPDIGFSLAVS